MTTITRDDDKIVLRLESDLVASRVPEVKKQLKELVDTGHRVAVDLADVHMVDSTGIGLLMAAHNSLQKNDHSLIVLNASEDIRKLFQTMRLDQRFIMGEP
ncbi:MAG: STAS domain-containing protein [Desulfovermiculus sp.]